MFKHQPSRPPLNGGFSIVELLVVIAIIGLLGAIALPSYTAYVYQAQRNDAIADLLQLTQSQERWYAKNGNYTSNIASLGVDTHSGYSYSMSVTAASSYTISMTATSADQLNDSTCRTLKINYLGVKSSTDSSADDSTANCWKE